MTKMSKVRGNVNATMDLLLRPDNLPSDYVVLECPKNILFFKIIKNLLTREIATSLRILMIAVLCVV